MKLTAALAMCVLLVTACNSDANTPADAAAAAAADAQASPDAAAMSAPDARVLEDAAAMGSPDALASEDAATMASPDASLLAYGAMCTSSTECETGICERVEMRNICTAMCMNGVCPLPNSSCNNRGFCKPN